MSIDTPSHNITAEDVDAYVASLLAQGTPWGDGCASLIVKLWGASHSSETDAPQPHRRHDDPPQQIRTHQRSAPSAALPKINLDGRDFYEMCQRYRHAHDGFGRLSAAQAFADLQTYIRTGKLPFDSYEPKQ